MNPDLERFLNLRHLPASAPSEQAAGYPGISPHEIPVIVAKGLLKPLGHPAPNAPKFFLTATLEDLRRDEKWFGKMRDTIGEYWRYKKGKKLNPPEARSSTRQQSRPAEMED